jgi:hypothetical protein
VTAAQGAGAAERSGAVTHSRAARRCARFSDFLGALAEENGPMDEKRKPDNASAEGTGAFPLFPLGPGNDETRVIIAKLGSEPATGREDAAAPAPAASDMADAGLGPEADFAPHPATPQTNPAGRSLLPEAFATRSCSAGELAAAMNFASPQRLPGASDAEPVDMASAGVPSAPAKAAPLPFGKGASIEDASSAQVGRAQPVSENGLGGLQAPISATEKGGASIGKADTSPLPAGYSPAMARNQLQTRISQLRNLIAGRADCTVSEPSSGLEPTAPRDEPLLQAGPDAVQLAAYSAPTTADAAVETAAPAGIAARHRDGEAAAGLAFTARVVPLPAAESVVSATGADVQQRESSRARPDAGKTPAQPAPHFSNDPKREEALEITGRAAAGQEPQVTFPLAPAASIETAAPPAGESGRAAPGLPHPRPSGLTEGPTSPPASPAREIQLQLHEGEQRVDVRLTERSGELRVAVRTPDAQLAGALRAGLPALSARLEQTGFRADTWHPAMAHESARPPGHVSPSVSDSNDTRNGSRQGGQQQSDPRQPRPNTAHAAKSQRKEFRWLMSQLP